MVQWNSWVTVLTLVMGTGAVPTTGPVGRADAGLVVELKSGTYIGSLESAYGVEKFNGIPYAKAPRLRPPVRLADGDDIVNLPKRAPACPQMTYGEYGSYADIAAYYLNIEFIGNPSSETEECLSVSVHRPAGTKSGDKLPVMVYFYGGAFSAGASQIYDGQVMVQQSVRDEQPYIWVIFNYRVGGFGFLGGKEIKAANSTNLGLRDQRMALEWVADNIETFGGNSDRVTLVGQSAGAISVVMQMMANGGDIRYKDKPLFHAAYIMSGSALPLDAVDGSKAQDIYDLVVREAGCANAPDTLECLRNIPDYNVILRAVRAAPNTSAYRALALSYLPRPDGDILQDSPHKMLAQGRYAKIPLVVAQVEDEGTVFVSELQSNLTTTDKLTDYMKEFFFNKASRDRVKSIVNTYPPDRSQGAPFRTGNTGDPALKRLAAIFGDLFVTAPRHYTLNTLLEQQVNVPLWTSRESFLHNLKVTPGTGTFHGSDLVLLYSDEQDSFVVNVLGGVYYNNLRRRWLNNFIYNHDPNKGIEGSMPFWPQYTIGNKRIMWTTGLTGETAPDNLRLSSMKALTTNMDELVY